VPEKNGNNTNLLKRWGLYHGCLRETHLYQGLGPLLFISTLPAYPDDSMDAAGKNFS
jgi:hypothetical protein